MSAPVRQHHQATSAKGLFTTGNHFNSRRKIDTNLQNDDFAIAFGSDKVRILKMYNCSAMVEYANGEQTVINFDNLVKCE